MADAKTPGKPSTAPKPQSALKAQIEAAFQMPVLPDGEHWYADAAMVRDILHMRISKIIDEHKCGSGG